MIFQQFNLLMQRTCLKNVCFPMELAGVKKAEAEKRPTGGNVVIDGVAMETLSPASLRKRRREITMIFQQFNLLMQRGGRHGLPAASGVQLRRRRLKTSETAFEGPDPADRCFWRPCRSCQLCLKYTKRLCLVKYRDEYQDREFVFLTNVFHLTSLEVAELYKNRW